jgi:hypothetical protein
MFAASRDAASTQSLDGDSRGVPSQGSSDEAPLVPPTRAKPEEPATAPETAVPPTSATQEFCGIFDIPTAWLPENAAELAASIQNGDYADLDSMIQTGLREKPPVQDASSVPAPELCKENLTGSQPSMFHIWVGNRV